MAAGRWYPTVTTLADGRMVTVAGRDSASNEVLIPEIWEGGQLGPSRRREPAGCPYYPRQFVAPNGRLFYAGERIQARWLDVDAVTDQRSRQVDHRRGAQRTSGRSTATTAPP